VYLLVCLCVFLLSSVVDDHVVVVRFVVVAI